MLLVLALTGVCMLSVCQAVDLANHLGGRSLESILQETDGDFTSSSMFQQLLAKNLYYITRWHLCIIQRKQSATARP
ncbi:MAG: hypothetical protein ACLU4W_00680 [Acutalibacteraceae bacterium]